MDIGIYNESASPNAIGGAEFCSAVLASHLRNAHRVEIINHDPYFTIDNLSLNTGSTWKAFDTATSRGRLAPPEPPETPGNAIVRRGVGRRHQYPV